MNVRCATQSSYYFAFLAALVVACGSSGSLAQRHEREVTWVNPDIASRPGLSHSVLSSKAMGHDVGYVVWTPPGLDRSGQTKYPTVYFLHGAGGSEKSDAAAFSSRVADATEAGKFPPAICVFPNGGMSGYRGDVESMIVDELIPLIDQSYPTDARSAGRVICGFSMGGAGSVWLSMRNPELFCGAGSWGGALSFRGRGSESPLLPVAKKNAKRLKEQGYSLLTINGDQDRPDAFKPLQEILQPLGIPHQLVTLEDTEHNLGKYYERAGDRMLEFLSERLSSPAGQTQGDRNEYSTCETWDQLVHGVGHKYSKVVRISDPGSEDEPLYNGFWFYDEDQFDHSGRYALAMRVRIQNREVKESDVGDIGYIDLRNNNAWTKIGETTAWNWQQGCRLQWRPGSNEILWNDRSHDGARFVCRAFSFDTKEKRTLPRPIYDVSSDGQYALTHDFARMAHAGTKYVGIPDRFEQEKMTANTGIEKMDMDTGEVQTLISLERLGKLAFPRGYDGQTNLYIFREGWNPSATRFIAFLRNLDRPRHVSGWSVSADGSDVRYFYRYPSHHAWLDDHTMLEGDHFRVYRDDGTGRLLHHLGPVEDNTDPTILPKPFQDWVLGDTYVRNGFQHLFLYHRPSKKFVPLAKLRGLAARDGIFRVDLHARTRRDGRLVCIDATHEGLGRQIYTMDIGHILDSPPIASGE